MDIDGEPVRPTLSTEAMDIEINDEDFMDIDEISLLPSTESMDVDVTEIDSMDIDEPIVSLLSGEAMDIEIDNEDYMDIENASLLSTESMDIDGVDDSSAVAMDIDIEPNHQQPPPPLVAEYDNTRLNAYTPLLTRPIPSPPSPPQQYLTLTVYRQPSIHPHLVVVPPAPSHIADYPMDVDNEPVRPTLSTEAMDIDVNDDDFMDIDEISLLPSTESMDVDVTEIDSMNIDE